MKKNNNTNIINKNPFLQHYNSNSGAVFLIIPVASPIIRGLSFKIMDYILYILND